MEETGSKGTMLLNKLYDLVMRRASGIVLPGIPEERLRREILERGRELVDLVHCDYEEGENMDFDWTALEKIAKMGFPQIAAGVFGNLVDDVIGDPMMFALTKVSDYSTIEFRREKEDTDEITFVCKDTGIELTLSLCILLGELGKYGSVGLFDSLRRSGILTKEETRKALKAMTFAPRV